MAKVLIVEARFYDHLNDLLLEGARAAIEAAGHEHETVTVPGALEVPGAIAIADAARAASIRSVQLWPTGGDGLDAVAAGGVAPVLSRPFSRDALLVALGVAATMEALVPEAA